MWLGRSLALPKIQIKQPLNEIRDYTHCRLRASLASVLVILVILAGQNRYEGLVIVIPISSDKRDCSGVQASRQVLFHISYPN